MEDYRKTLYNWCLLNNLRLNNESELHPDTYMTKEIGLDEFKEILTKGYSPETPPNKPEKYLELRMYGLVPYNISPIQQAIQFGHATDQYYLNNFNEEKTQAFLKEWKTYVILNGGTSGHGIHRHGYLDTEYVGSMQNHLADLQANGVTTATFFEPDLNGMLTAIVFLIDERVFNKKLYPDYTPPTLEEDATIEELNQWGKDNDRLYAEWVERVGGQKNVFLREFLNGKRLA